MMGDSSVMSVNGFLEQRLMLYHQLLDSLHARRIHLNSEHDEVTHVSCLLTNVADCLDT